MNAIVVTDPACQLVRNRGPFPFIQSEGGFVEPPAKRNSIRDKPCLETANLPYRDVRTDPAPCSDVILSDAQLEAIIRLRQKLDLQRTPIEPLGPRPKPIDDFPDSKSIADSSTVEQKVLASSTEQSQQSSVPFKSPTWSAKMSVWDRLSTHHTLNSVRNHALMHRPFEINSNLEFLLNSMFDQSQSIWADSAQVAVQPETLGRTTWKVLRNTRAKEIDEVLSPSPYAPKKPPPGEPGGPIGASLYGGPHTSLYARKTSNTASSRGSIVSGMSAISTSPSVASAATFDRKSVHSAASLLRASLDHPLRYGGITDKLSPYSVKLAISGNHVSQTNDGYSRKIDGTYFS